VAAPPPRLAGRVLFLVYLSLYSLERFALSYVSSYQIVAFGLTQSQMVAVASLAAGLLGLWRLRASTAAVRAA
jgi:prolipoprotein diacylglyceryltransferase